MTTPSRADREPTQTQIFAQRLGIDESYVSYLKRGERKPSLNLFLKMIRVFELDTEKAIEAYEAGQESFSDFICNVILPTVKAHDE